MAETQVRFDLEPGTPERVRVILAAIPGIAVRRAKKAEVCVHGRAYRLMLLPNGIQPPAQMAGQLMTELAGPEGMALVVAEKLAKHVRAALEGARCSYADATGAAHLVAPGLLLHIEPTARRSQAAIPPPRGIGALGVRVVQTLLAEHAEAWAVTTLAARAGVSAGEAHRVVLRLQTEGLLTAAGAGKARRRRVANPHDVLEWLARVPAARRIHARVRAFLYARDPDDLLARFAHAASERDLTYAMTGAAAAYVMGTRATTALPELMIRIPPTLDLADVATTVGAEVVEGGANLAFVRDVGEVGIYGRAMCAPAYVAPPVRVWLDMLGEPRGEDAATLFREAMLAY
ncbi:MAG: helix-turn-helix domain-containing protein [Acidobacteria bacterium]|nr:helix-turn-helix domain-containing protein [Acidobacteriota bacterium]